ncbi:IclR family transcriptional regulator C-terminal domain-containing protein [Glaciihabitans sp. UYNi722]|uniref:IclR family transcriptional regulator domain-containing protein n=1 Tax=Glaciihabitans sp. UYNi722 TaxID=3156344 RepID=UPI00339754EB
MTSIASLVSAAMNGSTPKSEANAGLARGLAIMESFSAGRPQLSITEAARAIGVAPAMARRCLLTLEATGYVVFDGKFYRPTPRMVRLAATYLETAALPRLAQKHLDSVRDHLHEAASLAVLEGGDVLFIARAEPDHLVATNVRVGSRLPPYLSATGWMLLGTLNEEQLDDYLGGVQEPLDTIERARQQVAVAREARYALTDEELGPGVRSLAVPVVDHRGQVFAAMSVATFSARETVLEMLDRVLPVLKTAAERLGTTL